MTKHPTSILLFAAGFGTRMAPLTNDRPKPMINVAGRPLLDHALDHCDGLKTVVNVHYFADQIENHLLNRNILISDEREEICDTGGGLKKALPLLEPGPVFTMNTDAAWAGANPLLILKHAWKPEIMDGLLLMIPHANATAHIGGGDFDILENGTVQRGQDHVFSGAQIVKTHLLNTIEDDVFSMWRLWDQMLEAGRLHGAVYPGLWCDVGHPDSIPVAEEMLDRSRV